MSAAIKNASWPEVWLLIPIKRAPVRLTAVARKALPLNERSKYSHNIRMSAKDEIKIMMA